MWLKKPVFIILCGCLVAGVLAHQLLLPRWLAELTAAEQQRITALTSMAPLFATKPQLDAAQMMADLRWLADPAREGRAPGTPGGLAARQWLVSQFQQIGLAPAGTDGYLQPYQVEAHYQWSRLLRGRNAKIPGVADAANILGSVAGLDPSLKPIVITAHYDHLGVHDGKIFAGADDNASGVAALLELARFFKKQPLQHPILFIALDSEEKGLQGAVALFRLQLLQPEQLKINVNLDMLSRDTGQVLLAVGSYHHPWLLPILEQQQQQSAVKLVAAHDRPWYKAGDVDDYTLSSDHGVFHQQGVPFIYFGVPDHPDYHSERDTADKVDVTFYHQAVESVLGFLQLLDPALKQV
jgi:Zn-dependent M28 family amino/carboxypeptidase